jgi:hypothetical protein
MFEREAGRSCVLRSVPEGLDEKTAEIRRTVQVLRRPGEVAEVRAFRDGKTTGGYFDDLGELARCAASLDDRGYQVYVTLNPVQPALLARSENALRTGVRSATTDGDVVERTWLPVDLDPVRPSGISASDFEKRSATQRAVEIRNFLAERGWPTPLYRVELPNDTESLDLVKGVLEALDFLFSDGKVSVDTGVANAARIWKLYGTTARKGNPTGERSHRKSRLLTVPGVVDKTDLGEAPAWR